MYGDGFSQAVIPLRIVVWHVIFSLFGAVRNVWLLAEGNQKYLWRINLYGVIFNVLLNLMLIPPFGATGAAITSLITQVFSNVIVCLIIKPIRRNNYLLLRGLDFRILWNNAKRLLKMEK